jgi:hypothetical protein
MAAFMKQEEARWKRVIEEAQVKAD